MASNDNSNGFGDKLPPQDLEAERSVIGACLLESGAIDRAQMIVGPSMFYSDAHGRIFAAAVDLHNKNHAVDAVTVAKELTKRKQLEDCGGPQVLARCLEAVPHTAHVEHYARSVRETWVKRTAIDACNRVLRDAHDPAIDTDELLEHLDHDTQKLLETGIATDEVMSLSDIMVMALSQQPEEGESRAGLMTGFPELDEMTGGLRGGNLITIAARSGMGKSACALSIALYMVQQGHPVLCVSLEMSKLELAERLLSMQSNVPAFVIRKNVLEQHQRDWIIDAGNALASLPLTIDDRGEQTISRIGASVRLFKRRAGIQCVVIDYLQLVEPDDRKLVREQQVSTVMRRLKLLAKSVDLPIIVLAQLNREVEKRDDKKPRLSDLRESGAIEQDSDGVWFIHRDDYYEARSVEEEKPIDIAELIVAKNRNGPRGSVKVEWREHTMRFGALSPEQQAIAAADSFL